MREIDPIALGRRVALRRKKLKLSAKKLGDRTGYSQQGITSIESGKVKRPGNMSELATELRTSINWLRWQEGPEEIIDPECESREELHHLADTLPLNEVQRMIRSAQRNRA